MTSISVTRDVAAPAGKVWALVSDLPRMGEWSDENDGGTWKGGATGPEVGARFVGVNRNGKKTWKTAVKVVRCTDPTVFEFEVTSGPLKVARWTYEIESTETGCRVTETWTDQRGWIVTTLGKPVSGVDDRGAHNRAGMETTLANLAAAAETLD